MRQCQRLLSRSHQLHLMMVLSIMGDILNVSWLLHADWLIPDWIRRTIFKMRTRIRKVKCLTKPNELRAWVPVLKKNILYGKCLTFSCVAVHGSAFLVWHTAHLICLLASSWIEGLYSFYQWFNIICNLIKIDTAKFNFFAESEEKC